MSTRSPCRVEQLFFLARREPTIRKQGNLERSCTFSIYKPLIFKICSSLLPYCTYQVKWRRNVFFCPPYLSVFKPSLTHWISYPLNPPTLNFLPNQEMLHIHVGPTLELKLTHSALDMWHTVRHSKCAKCSALRLLPRKTCKFRLSQNST